MVEAGRAVSVRGLRKEFPTPDGVKVAVDSLDLDFYAGQITCLLGHNGAGKTTVISMLTGLITPDAGAASVFGRDMFADQEGVRTSLGVCPQHDVLWPELTVEEHLHLFAALKGVPPAAVRAEGAKALALVGLTEKAGARVSALSGGMKRKLSVCLAFLGGSKVVFLDEPTSGVDPYSRRSMWNMLQNAREGRVIVLTT
jgi:ABC-type multidrug transport system ATPase subunit